MQHLEGISRELCSVESPLQKATGSMMTCISNNRSQRQKIDSGYILSTLGEGCGGSHKEAASRDGSSGAQHFCSGEAGPGATGC